MFSYDMEIIEISGIAILGFAVISSIYFLWKNEVTILGYRKQLRKEKKKENMHFYCEACETSNDTFLKVVNLAKEPPTLLRKCIRCENTMIEETFEWKHKKMILTDEWELAGSHRQTDIETEEQNIIEKATDFIEKKNEFPYKCRSCDMKFKFPVELRWHKTKLHPVQSKAVVEEPEDPKPEPQNVEDLDEEIEDTGEQQDPKQSLEDAENMDIPLYEDDEAKESKE
jgi:hypothetical protein